MKREKEPERKISMWSLKSIRGMEAGKGMESKKGSQDQVSHKEQAGMQTEASPLGTWKGPAAPLPLLPGHHALCRFLSAMDAGIREGRQSRRQRELQASSQ